MSIEPRVFRFRIRYDALFPIEESNIASAIVSGIRRTYDPNLRIVTDGLNRWTLRSSNVSDYDPSDLAFDPYACTHVVLTNPSETGHLEIKTGVTASPHSKTTVWCRWVPDPTTVPADPTDPFAVLVFFQDPDDPLSAVSYPKDNQASPWCSIAGNDPESNIWDVSALRHTTPAVGVVYHGYADIVETEASITLSLYQPEVRSFPGDTNYESQHFEEDSSQWLFAMHVGNILTPDNSSDPDWGITGEGIMSGWYGVYRTNGNEGTISRGMLRDDGSSILGDCDAWMRTGYHADKPGDYEVRWERMVANASMIQGNTREYSETNDPATNYTLLADFGTYERLVPYRVRTSESGSMAITRFIRQRRFDLNTLDTSDPITPLEPGSFRNSRDASTEISWLHQKAEFNTSKSGAATSFSNTVHIWRRDDETEEVDP